MSKPTIIIFFIGFFTAFASFAIQKDSGIVCNKGISGNNTQDLLQRINKDVMILPKGVVIMLVGSNDMINSSKLLSKQKFKENYKTLIKLIKQKHSLLLLNIPPFYEPYLLSRHQKESYGKEGPENRVIHANYIINELAEENNCPLIDLNKILTRMGGASKDSMSLFRNEENSNANDGVHPTKVGNGVIASIIYQYLKDKNLTSENIICFGDSITYGVGVEGRGTTSGFTYPAILKKLLN